MKATTEFTTDILKQVFEQNIINGAQMLMEEDGDLHGIPAKAAAYIWKFNNTETVIGTYYIIQNGFAYVVWTIVPRELLEQRSTEADKIIDSFELLKPSKSTSGLLGGIGSIGSSSTSQKSTTPANVISPNSGYLELVSDDACIEHLYPKNYKATDKQVGQTIWENGSGVKMILQTIFKQGSFRGYMSNQISSISGQGADIVKNKYQTINGLEVLQYSYTYGDTYFAYFAVENNDMFYLVGFVGDKLSQLKIVDYANHVVQSVKKAPCSTGATQSSGPAKTATISHLGFDFSTGQKGYADGETIGWCPGGSNPNYSKGVWWRSSGDTNYKNLGNVSLSSVNSIPSSWDKPAVPLLPGNVYVIKCKDGYAAVKVISADENGQDWPVKVEYKFTSGNSF